MTLASSNGASTSSKTQIGDGLVKKTAMGRWFYKKMENSYNWAANRYGFEVLKSEDKWKKKYPNVAKKIEDLEKRIKKLEQV